MKFLRIGDLGGISKIGGINKTNGAKTVQSQNGTVKMTGVYYQGNLGQSVQESKLTVPEDLVNKFADVTPAKYEKGIQNLEIADADYIPDESFKEKAYSEA